MTAQQPQGAPNTTGSVPGDGPDPYRATQGENVLPPEVLAALQNGDATVCMAQCYPCMFDSHFDPPKWHTWADDDDVEHARNTGQPDPRESRCGCECANTSTKERPTT